MDWENLFNALPSLISLFIPGFVFIKTFRFFGSPKSDSFEGTVVASIAISYVLDLLVELVSNCVKMTNEIRQIVPIVIAFVFALVIVKLKTAGCLKGILKWIGKVSDSEHIWQELLDPNRGSHIRCFSTFNYQKVRIEGDVSCFDICEDGECSVGLKEYTVIYDNGDIYELKGCYAEGDEPVMYVNTRDIHGLEITYGQKKRKSRSFWSSVSEKIFKKPSQEEK